MVKNFLSVEKYFLSVEKCIYRIRNQFRRLRNIYVGQEIFSSVENFFASRECFCRSQIFCHSLNINPYKNLFVFFIFFSKTSAQKFRNNGKIIPFFIEEANSTYAIKRRKKKVSWHFR